MNRPTHDQLELPKNRPTITCDECGRRFALKDRGNPRLYCSDACRMRAYRRRIKKRNERQIAANEIAQRRAIENTHAERWINYLAQQNISRSRAEKIYRALLNDGWIEGPDYEQRRPLP